MTRPDGPHEQLELRPRANTSGESRLGSSPSASSATLHCPTSLSSLPSGLESALKTSPRSLRGTVQLKMGTPSLSGGTPRSFQVVLTKALLSRHTVMQPVKQLPEQSESPVSLGANDGEAGTQGPTASAGKGKPDTGLGRSNSLLGRLGRKVSRSRAQFNKRSGSGGAPSGANNAPASAASLTALKSPVASPPLAAGQPLRGPVSRSASNASAARRPRAATALATSDQQQATTTRDSTSPSRWAFGSSLAVPGGAATGKTTLGRSISDGGTTARLSARAQRLRNNGRDEDGDDEAQTPHELRNSARRRWTAWARAERAREEEEAANGGDGHTTGKGADSRTQSAAEKASYFARVNYSDEDLPMTQRPRELRSLALRRERRLMPGFVVLTAEPDGPRVVYTSTLSSFPVRPPLRDGRGPTYTAPTTVLSPASQIAAEYLARCGETRPWFAPSTTAALAALRAHNAANGIDPVAQAKAAAAAAAGAAATSASEEARAATPSLTCTSASSTSSLSPTPPAVARTAPIPGTPVSALTTPSLTGHADSAEYFDDEDGASDEDDEDEMDSSQGVRPARRHRRRRASYYADGYSSHTSYESHAHATAAPRAGPRPPGAQARRHSSPLARKPARESLTAPKTDEPVATSSAAHAEDDAASSASSSEGATTAFTDARSFATGA